MSDKQKVVFISVLSVVVAVLAFALVYMFRLQKKTETEMEEMVEMMTYEKEQLEEEYLDVANEIEGVSYRIDNDSLNTLIEKEQKRVQALLEELRTVKATNARRISELKAELSSVRKVLVYYIAQVDSLSTVNEQLVRENTSVRRQYDAISRRADTLAQERKALAEKVTIASQLEAYGITVNLLNSRERKTTSVKKLRKIEVSYSILKNVTAPVGMKKIYARITTEDNTVLQKNEGDLFLFEGKEIPYSSSKSFEYAGEELNDILYYNVTETLLAGNYKVELFVDGHKVGSQTFALK